MKDNEFEEDIYIIPHNYQDNGKILGIIEPNSFFLGLGWLILFGLLLYYIPLFSIDINIFIFLMFGGLPAAIIFVGFGHDSVVDFAKYFINFHKNARVYHYEK